ncbi:phage head-tail connector protein [Methylobacterium sp. PvR107]|uniref:head-tail connector protein n=1 Tax=Methylobacterium sp. PvR107 TaxID=2806597 RepID=UPI001AE39C68|nr:phage head-tail connector protein [Methylobacterium sp. PvR107]MBP1179979.1 putative phiE125 gp8 family phage protein [Methylobacterium sp. PvR107]
MRRISDPLTPEAKLEVVTLEKAKAHLRVRHADEDDLIQDLIVTGFDFLHGPDGWLNGYCLLAEQFELFLPAINSTAELPLRPVEDVDAVAVASLVDGAYEAAPAGTFVTATENNFAVVARLLAASVDPAGPRAYRIAFSAGHASADAVPMSLKQSILLLVGHWYVNREATLNTAQGGTTISRQVEFGLKALAGRLRVSPDHS